MEEKRLTLNSFHDTELVCRKTRTLHVIGVHSSSRFQFIILYSDIQTLASQLAKKIRCACVLKETQEVRLYYLVQTVNR